MPELPEVEAIARTLRPLVLGKRIRCAHVFHPIAVKPQVPATVVEACEGRTIVDVWRHGKYLFLELDHRIVEMHFKFDGQLVWFPSAANLLKRANQEPDGTHVDVAFEFGRGVLGFADRRHFGRVHAWESREECTPLGRLGEDALSREFTRAFFYEQLKASKRPLKDVVLDQGRMAGVGNIYSCEALWHARLNPKKRANSVTSKQSAQLHKAIVSVLRRALKCCLNPAPVFRDEEWWFQGIEKILRVYQREGFPCRRCGRAIQRIEQSGRSTYWCLRCQV